jgi:hypothetical protein
MIRVNLLPREDKGNKSAPVQFNFKVGDMVLPAAVVGLAALVIAGTAISQQSKIGQLGSSIQRVGSADRPREPAGEGTRRAGPAHGHHQSA